MQEDPVTLYTLCGGGAVEIFDAELQAVVANILDPNSEAKATRELNLKIKIKPDESRRLGQVAVMVTSKISPIKGLGTTFFFGRKGGKCFAVENNPAQGELFDSTKPVAVDFKTGEVQE